MSGIKQQVPFVLIRKVDSHLILFSYFVLFLVLPVFSEPIFHDDFSDPFFTTVSWILNDPNNCTMSFSENGIVLKNSHQYNSIIAFHSLSKKYQSFSISTHIFSESAGSGIFFNISTGQSGKINGYAALIAFEKVELLKFSSGTHTTLASRSSPFIKSCDNLLTVSRKDSMMMLFCNGYFLYSYCDNELPPGDCAMMIQPRSTTVFSDFEFQSTPLDSLTFKPFFDNFDKTQYFGWRKNGSGFSSIIDSSLEITASQNGRLHYTIDHPMRSFKLDTEFFPKKITSTDSSGSGIVITGNFQCNEDSSFCLRIRYSSNQTYEIEGISDVNVSKNNSNTQDSSWKRLRLVYDNSLLRFYCDGNLCFESVIDLNIKSAGLFSSKGSVARFDNFTLESFSPAVATQHNAHSNSSPQSVSITSKYSYTFRIDLLGRSVPSLKANTKNKYPKLLINNSRKYIPLNITK